VLNLNNLRTELGRTSGAHCQREALKRRGQVKKPGETAVPGRQRRKCSPKQESSTTVTYYGERKRKNCCFYLSVFRMVCCTEMVTKTLG